MRGCAARLLWVAATAALCAGASDGTAALLAVLALVAALVIPLVLLLRTQRGEAAKRVRRRRPRGSWVPGGWVHAPPPPAGSAARAPKPAAPAPALHYDGASKAAVIEQ